MESHDQNQNPAPTPTHRLARYSSLDGYFYEVTPRRHPRYSSLDGYDIVVGGHRYCTAMAAAEHGDCIITGEVWTPHCHSSLPSREPIGRAALPSVLIDWRSLYGSRNTSARSHQTRLNWRASSAGRT